MAQQQILLRSPPVNRRQSQITTAGKPASPSMDARKKTCGEMTGGAAAECAAVCCCCPFTIMEFLYLALYRLPCGLCRKMWRKSALRRKKRQQRLTMKKKKRGSGHQHHQDEDVTVAGTNAKDEAIEPNNGGPVETPPAAYTVEEEKMWDSFYGTGFWRSPSQRES